MKPINKWTTAELNAWERSTIRSHGYNLIFEARAIAEINYAAAARYRVEQALCLGRVRDIVAERASRAS